MSIVFFVNQNHLKLDRPVANGNSSDGEWISDEM